MVVKEMTGQKFGKLIVLERDFTKQTAAAYWLCQCECGNKKSIRGDRLRKGGVKNCGCEKKERQKDLTSLLGKEFGKLLVLERDLTKPIGHGQDSFWKCRCECGKEVSIRGKQLTSGKTKSCGCYRSETTTKKNTLNIANKRYGKLIALENTFNLSNHHSYIWKCICDCGNFCFYSAEDLQSGKINSCGCGIRSKGELKIATLLRENNITFSQEISFLDFKNEITKHPYRFDFAILKNGKIDFIIEFDGIQHYKETTLFRDTLQEIQEKDNIKNNYCFSHNIILKRIPYWDLEQLTIEDILSNKYIISKGENK